MLDINRHFILYCGERQSIGENVTEVIVVTVMNGLSITGLTI